MAPVMLSTSTGAPIQPEDKFSYIWPIGYHKSSKCGYCGRYGKSQSQRFSYYAAATSLTPEFYKTLLDRYWRRSGTLLYRPDQRKACCPHYTLRLDSAEFKASKDQRQAVNRFNRYIIGDAYAKEAARLYPLSRAEAKKRDNEFVLTERIHEAEYDRIKTPPEPAHRLQITLEDDSFTEEKYKLFENYQRVVHNEDDSQITPSSFKRFLCSSPIMRQTVKRPDGTEQKFGSFHQCYRLDGKLVAVGVLDFIPECVSAVYFFYHESIHTFSPGKLSALREVSLAIEGGYRYWYPGFYIHSCPKMRYKMDYRPQYMLDPETLEWDLCDDAVLELLSSKAYVSLSRERKSKGKLAINGRAEPKGSGTETDNTSMTELDVQDDDAMDDDTDDSVDSMWVFETQMPGITPLEVMLEVNLDDIDVRLARPVPDGLCKTGELYLWDENDITEYGTFKASVAELVAAIGPDQIGNIRLARRSTH